MGVVLDVLAELGRGGVFEPRPQRGQHLDNRQLRRRAGVLVAQRDVGGIAGDHAERDADQPRDHVIQRIGFCVDGHHRAGLRGGFDLRHPLGQRLAAEHGFALQVGVVDVGQRVVGHIEQRAVRVRLGRGRWRGRLERRIDLAQPGLEAVARIKTMQRRQVGRAQRQRIQIRPAGDVIGQIAVQPHRDQPLRLRQPVERAAQVLAGAALDAVGRGDHALQRAVLGDPLGRGLRADLLDAGHVVDHIAHQRQVIDDALGRHAELGDHAGRIEPLVAHGVDQRHPVVDQLRQVLVAGGNDHLVTRRSSHARQRADGVVGLDARHHEHRPAQQLDHLVDGLDLLHQRLGHGAAVGLVVGVPLVAKGRAMGVEHAHRVLGLHVLERALQHGHHAVQGPGGRAIRAAKIGQRVVGAVEVAGAVNQQHHGQGRGIHRRIVRGATGAARLKSVA